MVFDVYIIINIFFVVKIKKKFLFSCGLYGKKDIIVLEGFNSKLWNKNKIVINDEKWIW